MTKKDYIAVAMILRAGKSLVERGHDAKVVLEVMTNDFIDLYAAENPTFDEKMFRKALEKGESND